MGGNQKGQSNPLRRELIVSGNHHEPPAHGTHSRYNNHDCSCEACRQARAAYLRGRAQAEDRITEATRPPDEIGAVEAAVIAELAEYPAAVEERPALAAVARALGRGMDCASFARSHAAMARQLRLTLDVLEETPKRARGKLGSVVQMVNSADAGRKKNPGGGGPKVS